MDWYIHFGGKALLAIHLHLKRKDFLWYIEDDAYKYKHLLHIGLVEGEGHKRGIQFIFLNLMIIFATNKIN